MLLKAKYDGICSICSQPVHRGLRIEWTPETRVAAHARCAHPHLAQGIPVGRATDCAVCHPPVQAEAVQS